MCRVGALLDFATLHPRISGRKQLRWYARAARLPDSRVDHVLEMVGMANDAHRAPREYSLGMKQRMGMATALLGDPDVLILDEPGNGMDPQGLRWIADLVQEYAETGRTVLMSSHTLADLARVADQLVVIHQGTLISNGPTQEFVTRFATSAVRVRSDNAVVLEALVTQTGAVVKRRQGDMIAVSGVTAEQIARLAAGAGVLLFELTVEQTTLEEAFVIASVNAESGVPRGAEMSVL